MTEGDLAIEGCLQGRLGRGVVTSGPWYARGPGIASPALLATLADRAAGLPLAIGILETNRAGQELAREAGQWVRGAPQCDPGRRKR